MRDGVLVSSVRQCEIYIAVKYTQLAAADKNAAGDGAIIRKTVQPRLVSRKEKRLI